MSEARTRPPTSRMGSSPLGLAAAGLGTVAWGAAGILVKLTAISGLTLPLYRLGLGLLLMSAAALALRRRITWAALLASAPGGLFFGADVALFFAALKRTSVADATFIGSLQPVLVLLLAGPLFGERLGLRQLAWMGLALAGVGVVVLGGPEGAGGGLAGDALATGALLAWAGYWLASKRARVKLATVEYMTGMFLVAGLLLTPFTLMLDTTFAVPRAIDWVWLALLGLVPSTGHVLFNWAHRYVPATISSVVQAGVPVVATGAAFLVLGESVTWLQVLGGLAAVSAIGAIAAQSAGAGDVEGAGGGTAP